MTQGNNIANFSLKIWAKQLYRLDDTKQVNKMKSTWLSLLKLNRFTNQSRAFLPCCFVTEVGQCNFVIILKKMLQQIGKNVWSQAFSEQFYCNWPNTKSEMRKKFKLITRHTVKQRKEIAYISSAVWHGIHTQAKGQGRWWHQWASHRLPWPDHAAASAIASLHQAAASTWFQEICPLFA